MSTSIDPFEHPGDLPESPQYPRTARLSGGVPPKTKAFADFMSDVKKTKGTKKGTKVLDKVVDTREANRLKRKALSALHEQFSVFELARILQDSTYSLEAYMRFLRNVRDDEAQGAKPRMEAANLIMKTVIGIMKAGGGEMEDFTQEVTDQDRKVLGAIAVAQKRVEPETPADNGDQNVHEET